MVSFLFNLLRFFFLSWSSFFYCMVEGFFYLVAVVCLVEVFTWLVCLVEVSYLVEVADGD